MHTASVLALCLLLALGGCRGDGGSGAATSSAQGATAAGSTDATASGHSPADAVFPPRANAAWVYDPHGSTGSLEAGYYAGALNRYNLLADAGERIGLVHPYGGDMEMYCPNGDPTRCRDADFKLSYTPDSLTGPLLNGLLGGQRRLQQRRDPRVRDRYGCGHTRRAAADRADD